jgi:hypothetical protein
MPMDSDPVVGAVYENADGRTFEVIGFDENEASVQLRYEDGATEDIDLDAWYEMDLEPVSLPDEDAEDEEELEESPDEDEDEYLDEDDDDDDDEGGDG